MFFFLFFKSVCQSTVSLFVNAIVLLNERHKNFIFQFCKIKCNGFFFVIVIDFYSFDKEFFTEMDIVFGKIFLTMSGFFKSVVLWTNLGNNLPTISLICTFNIWPFYSSLSLTQRSE